MAGRLTAQAKEEGQGGRKPPETSVAKLTRPRGGSGALVPPRPTWEYTILALGNSLERQIEQLTRMGALGWELVSLIAPGPPHGGLSLAYLKRPMNG
jgi:hypothetical protein